MKVVYFSNSPAHKRVIESFKESQNIEQIILAPKPIITSNIIKEDYSDCGISNIITYGDIKEAQGIIAKINPNVVAQTNTINLSIPKHIKKAYISHGMIGNHVIPMSKKGTATTWKGFDLYCGATEVFKDWINHATGQEQNIALNAMPQFDLLSDSAYFSDRKEQILGSTKVESPSKIILFCGFCCKDRGDFKKHNEDYFKTAIELNRIADKHNFLIFIKPRQAYKKIMEFLGQHGGWTVPYRKSYPLIQNSKRLHFITTTTHIYKYFFADMIVCNGCSTVEVEACVANKPLVLVRTNVSKEDYDPFDTVRSGAGIQVSDINDLENTILDNFNNTCAEKQKTLLQKIGISVDGKAYERVQQAIMKL